jgi:hypothetical protein
MPRRIAAMTACAAVTLSAWGAAGLAGPSSAAGADRGRSTAPDSARAQATRALHAAQRVTAGQAPQIDGSMALLQLRRTMHALSPADRRRAQAILARPTDHPDYYQQTYHAKAKRKCAGHICIHWVTKTRDAVPGKRWVTKMLHLMNKVWTFEVDKLGYHRPISDGTKGGGGSGMFDVYLKELYHQRLYGLTVAEQRAPYNKHLYSSYLLLDNDFKRSQYHKNPMQEARVTAAHEFFHAIQDAYDAHEDFWLMESTATWMEDQFDDSSNDNRQYLPWSQLRHPGTPLDTYSNTSFEEYGNWVFFEYLSERFGRGIVQAVWNDAAATHGGGHEYSAAAIRTALRRHGGMTAVFGGYASGNTVPAQTYAEGGHYPAAGTAATVTLTKSSPATGWTTYRVRHLASVNVGARPGAGLGSTAWHLRVRVDGPRRSTSPAVVVLVDRKHHSPLRRLVHLSQAGKGSVKVPFGRTRRVTVTLANASTDFRCHTGTDYSCHGTPMAPHPTFRLRLTAVRS